MPSFVVHLWRIDTEIVCVAENGAFTICLCLVTNSCFSGGPLERGLERVISDVLMGSLLVQSDSKTQEPLLLQVMLPVCIRERRKSRDAWVFLLDAQVRNRLLRVSRYTL